MMFRYLISNQRRSLLNTSSSQHQLFTMSSSKFSMGSQVAAVLSASVPKCKVNWESSKMKYSTENSFQSNFVGSSSFLEVVTGPSYVDKTLFIEAVMTCESPHILITAPRRFNKSINLDMLACFLQNRKHESLFNTLKIGTTETMEYCGVFPVVHLNLKDAVLVRSFEECVSNWGDIIYRAFKRLEGRHLIDDKNFSPADKKIYQSWCDYSKVAFFTKKEIRNGLYQLCRLAFLSFGKRFFLTIDEFDAISMSTLPIVNSAEFGEIITFYTSMIGAVVKRKSDFIERSVMTGVTRVLSSGTSHVLNNVATFPFMECERFVDFYGISDKEFSELMSRECNASIRHMEQDALNTYNGYTAFGRKIMSTWSVMNFIANKQVKPYWKSSGDMAITLEDAYKKPAMRGIIHKLMRHEDVAVPAIEFNFKNFKELFDDFHNSKELRGGTALLLHYFLQEGYLSVSNQLENGFTVRIPNTEIMNVFRTAILTFLAKEYKIGEHLLQDCVHSFQNLDVSNDNSCREVLSSICETLQKIFNRGPYRHREFTNERTLHQFINGMLYSAGFYTLSEIRVYQKDGTYKIYDTCAYRNDQGIVMEFKVDASPFTAMEQILKNKYVEGLIEVTKKMNVKLENYVLIGINLAKSKSENEESSHKLTACYIRNSLNRKDVKYVFVSNIVPIVY